MEMETNLLTGSELIAKKSNGPKDFPSLGYREYRPNNSWLENKQIQSCIEDKFSLLSSERIEKGTNLAKAEWLPKEQKVKVSKKVGKYWEVFGHCIDNTEWLFPEEALFLLEINALQLSYDEIPVSIEQSYVLLLGKSCSLNEYRVFSFLLKRGYKVVRHNKEVRVTRYEKQIRLDQIVEAQKRTAPDIIENKRENECRETVNSVMSDNENINGKEITSKTSAANELQKHTTKEGRHDTDVFVVEHAVEIIEIEDKEGSKVVIVPQQKKSPPCIIIEESDESNDSDDVIFISGGLKDSRRWYLPYHKCLHPQVLELIDLSNENLTSTVKSETGFSCGDYFDLGDKTKCDILKSMASVKNGITTINAPDRRFLPKGIEPKHALYRVNLKKKDELPRFHERNYSNKIRTVVNYPNYNTSTFIDNSRNNNNYSRYSPNNNQPNQSPRSFYNDPLSNNNMNQNQTVANFSNNLNNFQQLPYQNHNQRSLLLQACEIQMMAVGMMQTATNLLAAFNQQPSSSPMQNSNMMLGMNNFPNILNTNNQHVLTPFNQAPSNLMTMPNNINSYNNRCFQNQNSSATYSSPYNNNNFGNSNKQSRPFNRFRGGRHFNRRRSYNGRNRFYNRTFSETPERNKSPSNVIVLLDSDDEDRQVNVKRPSSTTQTNADKKPRLIIDLSEDVTSEEVEIIEDIKSEPRRQDFPMQSEAIPSTSSTPFAEIKSETGSDMDVQDITEEVRKESKPSFSSIDDKSTISKINDDLNNWKQVKQLTENQPSTSSTVENKYLIHQEIKSEMEGGKEFDKNMEMQSTYISSEDIKPDIKTEVKSEISDSSVEPVERIIPESTEDEVDNSSLPIRDSQIPDSEKETPLEIPPSEETPMETLPPETPPPLSWAQYKELPAKAVLIQPPAIELPPLEPLITSHESNNLGKFLDTLNIFEPIPKEVTKGKGIKISFDVYLPTEHFKKSLKTLPKFRIVVAGGEEILPTKYDMDKLLEEYQDETELLFAVVFEESIGFYSYNGISVPVQI